MPCALKYHVLLVLLLVCCCCAIAQLQEKGQTVNTFAATVQQGSPGVTDSVAVYAPFVVRNIIIRGNRKTKDKIILREIPFKKGDHFQLQDLVRKFEDARRQLMNTTLFHDVVVALKGFEGYNVDVLVEVKERWYIFPLPYFKPIDRNLNQWIVENKLNFNRVNYGIKVLDNNLTGNNDKLNVWLINGYTKQVSFNYSKPYIDKQLKWGMNVGLGIGKNREVNYNTVNDKQVFYKDENNFVRSFFRSYGEVTYRRAIKTTHRFGIAYNEELVGDTIAKLNPSYFSPGRTRIRFPELYYTMTYFDLDYIPYPTRGYAAELTVDKKGFNNIINLWQLSFKGSANYQLFRKTFLNLNVNSTVKLPFKQPYFNKQMLGYGDTFLQGYEYYVIDGVAGGYLKATLARQLFNFKIRIPANKYSTIDNIPFRVYGKIYGNAGYIHNPHPGLNNLTDRMLYSCGIGLDILTFYDFTLKLEWSFNQLGQNGLYLHKKSFF
jgi:outer membrane protein assembly factor BamA